MVARFRSLDTWEHLIQLDALSWDLPIFGGTKAGSLTVTGEHPELAMTWLSVAERFYYVAGATPGNGMTKLSVQLPINAFARSIAFTPLTGSLEEYIAGVLEDEFRDQTDAVYAMPYLDISYSGATNATLSCVSGEVIDFLSILQYAVEKGIDFTFTPGASTLGVYIHERQTEAHNLVLGDGHSQLQSYTRSYNTIDKITVRRVTVNEDETITVRSTEDWYVQPDGSVSTTAPSERQKGKWAVVSLEDDDIPTEDAAKEAASVNKSSYKLVFRSEKEFHLGDRVTARFGGMLQTGEITVCSISNNDTRFLYEMGTMAQTLTEKFATADSPKTRLLSPVKVETVELPILLEESDPEPLPKTGGTVGGNLIITGETTLTSMILASDSYGTALPASGVEGQVFFLLS